MPVSKEEVEAMIADANATADKHLEDKYSSAKVVEWLQAKPVSNGLAILLSLIIIIID